MRQGSLHHTPTRRHQHCGDHNLDIYIGQMSCHDNLNEKQDIHTSSIRPLLLWGNFLSPEYQLHDTKILYCIIYINRKQGRLCLPDGSFEQEIFYLDNWAIINQTWEVVRSRHRRNVLGVEHVGHESLKTTWMIDGSLFYQFHPPSPWSELFCPSLLPQGWQPLHNSF